MAAAATMLAVMLIMIPYICEGALRRKSTATEFLHKVRERRDSECFPGGCSETESSEVGELMESDGYAEMSGPLYNGDAAQQEANNSPAGGAGAEEGSGM